MDETTFFDDERVRVTNARFVVDEQTFAMNNITSITPSEVKPQRVLPVWLILCGLVLVLTRSLVGLGMGLALLLGGIAWFRSQKTTYHVVLHTAGGETSALKTHEPEYLHQVMAALNRAIVYRG